MGNDDTKGIMEAQEAFYRALNAMFAGDASKMDSVWSHKDDVTYLGPQGKILRGWDEVHAIWESQADMHIGGSVRTEGHHCIVTPELGVVQSWEIGTNHIHGKEVTVHIRATNVFRKENGQWKMVTHQTDLLPELAH